MSVHADWGVEVELSPRKQNLAVAGLLLYLYEEDDTFSSLSSYDHKSCTIWLSVLQGHSIRYWYSVIASPDRT